MILSDKDILEIQNGSVPLIAPFKEERLRGASYDVLLDGEITPMLESSGVIDLGNQDEIDAIYSSRVPIDGFVMKPGQYCLAALAEEITLPADVVAFVEPRTRYTRMGLLIARQFCNPGYSGRLQIGIYNASGNNLRLRSYAPVAQLVFHRLSSTPSRERLYGEQETAAYNNEKTFIGARAEEALSDEDRLFYDSLVSNLSKYGFSNE